MDESYIARLQGRRSEIDTTLRYLESERRTVEHNTEWINQAAYESRIDLLDRLTEWYRKEIGDIGKMLSRVNDKSYGLCLGCHEPTEAERLDTSPEAEFCFECQEYRESRETS